MIFGEVAAATRFDAYRVKWIDVHVLIGGRSRAAIPQASDQSTNIAGPSVRSSNLEPKADALDI